MNHATPALRPVEGHVRALCCECGELRLMKANYRGRGKNHTTESDPGTPAGWRMLVDLPCGNCGVLRRHAWLRDHNPYADYAESLNRRDVPADLEGG